MCDQSIQADSSELNNLKISSNLGSDKIRESLTVIMPSVMLENAEIEKNAQVTESRNNNKKITQGILLGSIYQPCRRVILYKNFEIYF